MSKPTLDSIATAKAKLEEELRKLEEQEVQLRQQQSADAYTEVMGLLAQYGALFTAKQKAEIVTAVGASSPGRPKKSPASKEVAPKYWLPHSGETWTGRGRPPRAFTAWEGTAAYKEWKARHPNEKFPKFPG
jgi:DNA-binding protein H-NS